MTDETLEQQRRRLAKLLPNAADKVLDSYEGLLNLPPSQEDLKAIRDLHAAGCSVLTHIEKVFGIGGKVGIANDNNAEESLSSLQDRARRDLGEAEGGDGDEP
ncbi:MAG TPA: hypothetical protein VEB64_13585 [Azospirillaceae bacterium]|nr:hypothetical protein [Azospirillaceae bacterium]